MPIFSFRALIEKRAWARAYQSVGGTRPGFLSGLRLMLSRSFGVFGFLSVILPIFSFNIYRHGRDGDADKSAGWQRYIDVNDEQLRAAVELM